MGAIILNGASIGRNWTSSERVRLSPKGR
nr:hypothetical protein [Pelagimonas varians]